ncbi:hypothetical protein JXR93_05605 [bacterium]|nr:hypothetical protein [bacterium]
MQIDFWRKNIIYFIIPIMIGFFVGCEKTRKGYEESTKKKVETIQKAKINTDNLNKAMESQNQTLQKIKE